MQLYSYIWNRFVEVPIESIRDFYEEHVLCRTKKIGDHVQICGSFLFQLFDEFGELKRAIGVRNLFVDTGRGWAVDRFQGTSVGVADFLALGTGGTAAAAGDTALQTEIGTRVQGTLSQPTAYTDRCVGTFGAGNATGALVEAGRLTAASGGVLACRTVYTVVNKAAGDSLQVQHDITT